MKILHEILFVLMFAGVVFDVTQSYTEDEKLYTESGEAVTSLNLDIGSTITTNILPALENIWSSNEAINENEIESTNRTIDMSNINLTSAQSLTNETKKIISCKLTMENSTSEERFAQVVEIANSTRLVDLLMPDTEVTNKETDAQCVLVLFYSRLCPFSAMAGPHFNAIARSFPDLKMVALDAFKYHVVNTQYGIVGVPTLILFHNGRPIAKFNGTEYTVHSFVKFIRTLTGIKEDVIAVHSQDFQGPVPSVMDKDIDYVLVLSWSFIITCIIYFFSKSFLWKLIIEMVKNNWREAEAQHSHAE